MRLFYYTIAAPALFLLRLIFWPFKLLFRFCRWLHRWRRERRRMRRADFDDMDGWEFEEYVAKLLVRDGYIHVEVTIQCKHYAGKIPNKAVQEAYAGAEFYGCDVPVVLTNSFFSPSALELGDEIGVELWDREELLRLVRRTRSC